MRGDGGAYLRRGYAHAGLDGIVHQAAAKVAVRRSERHELGLGDALEVLGVEEHVRVGSVRGRHDCLLVAVFSFRVCVPCVCVVSVYLV